MDVSSELMLCLAIVILGINPIRITCIVHLFMDNYNT